MAAKRRSKGSRALGSGTYGWGKNKHRNSGSRGGFGNAGTGKKSHNKKPSIWADPDYFGRYGFVSKGQYSKSITITLRDLDDRLPSWVKAKLVTSESGMIVIDLKKLGYDKLLSTGKLKTKAKILADSAADGVAEKVKAAGGELVVKTEA